MVVGTVEVDRVRDRQHHRVVVLDHPEVRDQSLAQQRVQGGAVGDGVVVLALDRRPVGGRERLERAGHDDASWAAQASARSRSILRPRKYAAPQSSAKIPPRKNISGMTRPSATAKSCSTLAAP